jgi:uncharacterized membrane protein (DUF485 family)
VLPLLLGALGSYALVLLAFAYWPALVRQHVIGAFNIAYLLAVSQFVMTFAVGVVYSRWAARVCDPLARRICAELDATAVAPSARAERRTAHGRATPSILAQEA